MGLSMLDCLSMRHDDDVLGQPSDLAKIVRHQNDLRPIPRHVNDQALDLLGGARIKAGGGFIEEEPDSPA
jgi:hypothetical protein